MKVIIQHCLVPRLRPTELYLICAICLCDWCLRYKCTFLSLTRYIILLSPDSSVDIATGYRLDSPGSIPGSAGFFSSPRRPDRLWGPPSLICSGYWGLFPYGQSSRGMKLTTHLHVVLRKVELFLHTTICLHGIVLD
jgi:hypothetical protein